MHIDGRGCQSDMRTRTPRGAVALGHGHGMAAPRACVSAQAGAARCGSEREWSGGCSFNARLAPSLTARSHRVFSLRGSRLAGNGNNDVAPGRDKK